MLREAQDIRGARVRWRVAPPSELWQGFGGAAPEKFWDFSRAKMPRNAIWHLLLRSLNKFIDAKISGFVPL